MNPHYKARTLDTNQWVYGQLEEKNGKHYIVTLYKTVMEVRKETITKIG